jgi:lysophospholipase L1-like esterase
MSKPIGMKYLIWEVATPTVILEQLIDKLGLQSPSRKIKTTVWKKVWQSLLVLLTIVMLVACGGSSTGDSSDGSDGSANQNPVAADDSAVTNTDTAVTINVLANDNDPDGDTLPPDTVEVTSQPGNGSATAQPNGTIDYQPNTGFRATDSFTYRVQDDNGALSNTATVTVTIVNRDPLAGGACFATPQESALADIDGMDRNGQEVKLPASDPDNDGLTFSLNADGSGGVGPITTDKGTVEITDPTTGTFQYTPKSPPSLRGVDTFDYQVEDTEGGTDTGTITVMIDPKIMPLGDSITLGIENSPDPPGTQRIGYRKKLYDDLIAAGYFVDFVGSLSNGTAAGIVDADHEGHSGINAVELANGGQPASPAYTGIFNALQDHPADIVLLHIGTNDLATTVAADVGQVLSEIDKWEDEGTKGSPVTVILARIIDQDPFTGTVNTLNNGVIGLAQNRIGTGDNIIIVNQQTALDYSTDMADNLHPKPEGYTKMADVWNYALIGEEGEGTPTADLGTGNNTGIPTGEAILTKCP